MKRSGFILPRGMTALDPPSQEPASRFGDRDGDYPISQPREAPDSSFDPDLDSGRRLALGESEGPSAAHRGVVSWGDAVLTCGPGTDPAMDNPQAAANWMGD